jgi:peptidoglycan hydrolase-like protein with peptidoglycan-binding domain
LQEPNGPNRTQLKTDHANAGGPQNGGGLNPSLEAVWLVQDELRDLGLYDGKQDGSYGEKTKLAVQEFQKAAGLPATGITDKKTLDALDAFEGAALHCRSADEISVWVETALRHRVDLSSIPSFRPEANAVLGRNGDVMNPDKADAIQGGLKDLGFYGGKHDRLYGEKTVAAVQEFQEAVGLPATGMTDKKTLLVLFPLRYAALNARSLPGPGADTLHFKEAETVLGHKLDLSKIPALKPPGTGSLPAHKKQGPFIP